MAGFKDYYQILGIPHGSSADEIKKAYRRLAKQYHPDINKNKGAEERFKEISEAYNTLSDPEKKRQYDTFGQAFEQRFGGAQGFGGFQGGAGQQGQEFHGFGDLGDLFSELFEMGGVRTGRGSSGRARSAPTRGKDLFVDVEVDFLEAVHGTKRDVRVSRGRGGQEISVKIPAGVDNASKIRVSGKGEAGSHGGASGDIYLRIHVNPHPLFWREGSDVYCEIPITIYEAALGASVSVPTLDGTAQMKIPAGTSSGQKFRLKEKGAPVLGKKGEKGDQYVVVKMVPPKKIDPAVEKMLKEWAEKHPYHPRED